MSSTTRATYPFAAGEEDVVLVRSVRFTGLSDAGLSAVLLALRPPTCVKACRLDKVTKGQMFLARLQFLSDVTFPLRACVCVCVQECVCLLHMFVCVLYLGRFDGRHSRMRHFGGGRPVLLRTRSFVHLRVIQPTENKHHLLQHATNLSCDSNWDAILRVTLPQRSRGSCTSVFPLQFDLVEPVALREKAP